MCIHSHNIKLIVNKYVRSYLKSNIGRLFNNMLMMFLNNKKIYCVLSKAEVLN